MTTTPMRVPLGSRVPTSSILGDAPQVVPADPAADTRGQIASGPLDSRVERAVVPLRQAGPTNQPPPLDPDTIDPAVARSDLRPSVERFPPMILRDESNGIRDQLAGVRPPIPRQSGMPTAQQLPWEPPRAIFRTVPVIGGNAPPPVGVPAITASRAAG